MKIQRIIQNADGFPLAVMTILLFLPAFIHFIGIRDLIIPAFATDILVDTSTDRLWLLYADKEHYSYNETVVIGGHVPLDKLASGQHVTIEVFTPDGNRYIKTVMEETVVDSGYYYYYFSLPPKAPNLADNETFLGEWKLTAIYNSIEDHTSFFLETKSQEERRTDLPSWQLLEECKGRGIKSGNCSESEILKTICIGPVCNPESKPPIVFDPVIVSLLIGAGVAVFAAALLAWKRKSKSVR